MNLIRPTLFALGLVSASTVFGASYSYDFGSSTGLINTSSSSTTFLPQPATGGGDEMVRVGTAGGSVELLNPGLAPLGSGSELVLTAPTTTSVNKFAIYDFTGAQAEFAVTFDLHLSGGSSGTFYFMAGDGTSFSGNSGFSGAQTFAGLRWAFGAGGAITTNNRNAASWNATGLSGTPFAHDTVYSVAVYGNNTTSAVTYTRDGLKSIAASTYDLWVNGTRVGASLAKAQLANSGIIDSFMFYGESSTGNVAKLAIDNLSYATAVPEPAGIATLLAVGGLLAATTRRRLRA